MWVSRSESNDWHILGPESSQLTLTCLLCFQVTHTLEENQERMKQICTPPDYSPIDTPRYPWATANPPLPPTTPTPANEGVFVHTTSTTLLSPHTNLHCTSPYDTPCHAPHVLCHPTRLSTPVLPGSGLPMTWLSTIQHWGLLGHVLYTLKLR